MNGSLSLLCHIPPLYYGRVEQLIVLQILSVDVRRDFFLIFKEAVNNAARHADCTQVEIEL